MVGSCLKRPRRLKGQDLDFVKVAGLYQLSALVVNLLEKLASAPAHTILECGVLTCDEWLDRKAFETTLKVAAGELRALVVDGEIRWAECVRNHNLSKALRVSFGDRRSGAINPRVEYSVPRHVTLSTGCSVLLSRPWTKSTLTPMTTLKSYHLGVAAGSRVGDRCSRSHIETNAARTGRRRCGNLRLSTNGQTRPWRPEMAAQTKCGRYSRARKV